MKIEQITKRSNGDGVDVTFTNDRGDKRNATIFPGRRRAVMAVATHGSLSFVPEGMIPASLAPAVAAAAA